MMSICVDQFIPMFNGDEIGQYIFSTASDIPKQFSVALIKLLICGTF